MSLATRLIGGAFWRAFGVVFLIFFGLQFLFRFLDQVDKVQLGFSMLDIILIGIVGAVRGLHQELPMITLIVTSVAMGSLAQTSELTVLRAAGLSTGQLFRRLVTVMSPLLVAVLLVAEVGLPQAERMQQVLKREASATLWTRDGDRFVFLRGRPSGVIAGWKHLELASGSREIRTLVSASTAKFTTGHVALTPATRLTFYQDALAKEVVDLQFDTALRPMDLQWLLQDPGVLSLSDLHRGARFMESQQLSAAQHALLFWQRLSMPLVVLAIALLGFVSAFGSLRSVSMGTRVFGAVVMGITFKLFSDVLTPTILLTGIAPFWGAVIPIACLLVGARIAYR